MSVKVSLSWAEANYGESEVRVYRGTAPLDPQNPGPPIATLPRDAQSYDDTTVTEGSTYYYRVSSLVDGVEKVSDELVVEAVASFAIPGTLFGAGEGGFYYDFTDPLALFTDAAMTTPVSADGQLVAAVADKSGNSVHAKQTSSSSRPKYRTDGTHHWIEFDGSNDFLLISGADFSGAVDGFTYAALIDPVDRTQENNSIFSRGTDTGNGDWWFKRRAGLAKELSLLSAGGEVISSTLPNGLVQVTTRWDSARVYHRQGGTAIGDSAKTAMNGHLTTTAKVGTRYDNVSWFQGKMYCLVVRAADTGPANLASLEAAVSDHGPA